MAFKAQINVPRYFDSSGGFHGFLHNGSTYTTLDDPLGDSTSINGIDGNNIVGMNVVIASETAHGFLATVPEPSSVVLPPWAFSA